MPNVKDDCYNRFHHRSTHVTTRQQHPTGHLYFQFINSFLSCIVCRIITILRLTSTHCALVQRGRHYIRFGLQPVIRFHQSTGEQYSRCGGISLKVLSQVNLYSIPSSVVSVSILA